MNEFLKIANKGDFLMLTLLSKKDLNRFTIEELLTIEGWNFSFEGNKIFLEKKEEKFFILKEPIFFKKNLWIWDTFISKSNRTYMKR